MQKSKNTINRWALAIICFLFGVLGVHRFLVGKFGTGVLYLFTVGLFGVGWVVDLVMIIFGMFTDNEGNVIK